MAVARRAIFDKRALKGYSSSTRVRIEQYNYKIKSIVYPKMGAGILEV